MFIAWGLPGGGGRFSWMADRLNGIEMMRTCLSEFSRTVGDDVMSRGEESSARERFGGQTISFNLTHLCNSIRMVSSLTGQFVSMDMRFNLWPIQINTSGHPNRESIWVHLLWFQ